MTQNEFVRELQLKLNGKLSEAQVMEFTDYYNSYFREQMEEGHSEAEIIADLGSPDLISRSILDASGYMNPLEQEEYEVRMEEQEQKEERKAAVKKNVSKITWIIGIVLLIVVIISLVGTVFTVMFRYSVPILLFLLIYMIIKDLKK